MRMGRILLVGTVCLVFASGASFAELLVYEGFDYTWGNRLEDCTDGGTGWGTNRWTGTSAATDYGAEIIGNRPFADLVTTGNAVILTNVSTDIAGANFRGYRRMIGAEITNGAMWVSFLWYDYDQDGIYANYYYYERTACHIQHVSHASPNFLMWPKRHWYSCAAIGGMDGGNNWNVCNVGTDTVDMLGMWWPYLILSKFLINDGTGTCTMWLLDEDDFVQITPKIRAGTVAEADLNANNQFYGSCAVTNVTVTTNHYFEFSIFDDRGTSHGLERNIILDEFRIGTALTNVVPVTEAATYVYEGFDYPLGQALHPGLTGPASTGEGWQGNWKRYGADWEWGAVIPNLTFGDLLTAGNAVVISNNLADTHPNTRGYTRRMGLEMTNGSMWVSFLFKDPWESPAVEYENLLWQVAPDVYDLSPYLTIRPNRHWADNPAVGGTGGDSVFHLVDVGASRITDGSVYLLLGKFLMNDATGTCKLWVMRETDFETVTPKIRAGTVAEADLNAHCYLSGSTNVPNITLATDDYFEFVLSDDISWEPFNANERNMYMDEIRIGTALADVVPVRPEPEMAYEGFDYPLGGVLHVGSFRDAHTGVGWHGNWGRSETTYLSSEIVTNLSFGHLQTAGNAVLVSNWVDSTDYRFYTRRLGLEITNGTLWTSYLFKDPAESSNVTYEKLGCQISTNAWSLTPGPSFAFWGNRHWTDSPSIGGTGGDGVWRMADVGTNRITDGAVYLLVSKFPMNDATGTCTMWVMREEDFEQLVPSIRAGSVSEAHLDTYAHMSGSTNVPNRDLAWGNHYHMVVSENWGGGGQPPRDMIVDEIRAARTLADVIPLAPSEGLLFMVK